MKYYILNIVVIVIFIGFYILTMTLDNEILYLGTEDIWANISPNNKLPFHGLTYFFGLPFVCLSVYFFQRFKFKDYSKSNFIVASYISITIIYLAGYGIYKIINPNIWNLYSYRDGMPARFSFFINIILTSIGILLYELIIKQAKRSK